MVDRRVALRAGMNEFSIFRGLREGFEIVVVHGEQIDGLTAPLLDTAIEDSWNGLAGLLTDLGESGSTPSSRPACPDQVPG